MPDDTLDYSEVRFFRICLKLSTYSNTEGNIWSASCKVEKPLDHTSVESRINLLACKISTDLDTCAYGSTSMTLPIETEPLDQIFGILVLRDEYPFRSLLDLKSQKVIQLTNHAHLKLFLHLLRKIMSLGI
jgi:hypothetical protein